MFESLILVTENTEKVTNAEIVASALQEWALKIAKNEKCHFWTCAVGGHGTGWAQNSPSPIGYLLYFNFASEV